MRDDLKDWRYYLFETHNAFCILDGGNLNVKDFRDFFHDIPMYVLLHRHTGYVRTFLTYLVIHLHFSRSLVLYFYNKYLAFREVVIDIRK